MKRGARRTSSDRRHALRALFPKSDPKARLLSSQRRELDLALELFSRMQVGVGQGGARLGQAGLGWAGLCGAVYEG